MKKKRVIAIVGSAPTTRDMANLEPPEVEIWSLSNMYMFLKRWDRWFEVHRPGADGMYEYATAEARQRHFEFLWSCGVPVYMLPDQVDRRIPTAVVFPVHEIGSRFRPYWVNSVSYALSLAIYEQVDEIHLWGIDLQVNTEYASQRPCVEYWLGVADALRIKYTVPHTSALLRWSEGAYGFYSEGYRFGADALKEEIAQIDAMIRNASADNGGLPHPQLIGVRRHLVQMLNKADPNTIGKPVESRVIATVQNARDEPVEVLKVY